MRFYIGVILAPQIEEISTKCELPLETDQLQIVRERDSSSLTGGHHPLSDGHHRRIARTHSSRDVKQPKLRRPLTIRARAPRISIFLSPHDGERSAETAPGACEAPVGVRVIGTPGHSSRSARHPLRSGRRASRRSTWRFLAVGHASVPGIVPRRPYSDAPRSRVIVPGGRSPEPSELATANRRAERHSPLRLQDCL